MSLLGYFLWRIASKHIHAAVCETAGHGAAGSTTVPGLEPRLLWLDLELRQWSGNGSFWPLVSDGWA